MTQKGMYCTSAPQSLFNCCLYVRATSEVKSGWVWHCDMVHSWSVYGTAQWETRPSISTMTLTITLSQYCANHSLHLLLKLSTRLGGGKHECCKSLDWLGWDSNSQPSAKEAYTLPIQSPDKMSEGAERDDLIANSTAASVLIWTIVPF